MATTSTGMRRSGSGAPRLGERLLGSWAARAECECDDARGACGLVAGGTKDKALPKLEDETPAEPVARADASRKAAHINGEDAVLGLDQAAGE